MLLNERMMTLAEISRLTPGKPSPTTIYRWCVDGLDGVRLEFRLVGRRIWTSQEALERFSQRRADILVQRHSRSVKMIETATGERQPQLAALETELATEGI